MVTFDTPARRSLIRSPTSTTPPERSKRPGRQSKPAQAKPVQRRARREDAAQQAAAEASRERTALKHEREVRLWLKKTGTTKLAAAGLRSLAALAHSSKSGQRFTAETAKVQRREQSFKQERQYSDSDNLKADYWGDGKTREGAETDPPLDTSKSDEIAAIRRHLGMDDGPWRWVPTLEPSDGGKYVAKNAVPVELRKANAHPPITRRPHPAALRAWQLAKAAELRAEVERLKLAGKARPAEGWPGMYGRSRKRISRPKAG